MLPDLPHTVHAPNPNPQTTCWAHSCTQWGLNFVKPLHKIKSNSNIYQDSLRLCMSSYVWRNRKTKLNGRLRRVTETYRNPCVQHKREQKQTRKKYCIFCNTIHCVVSTFTNQTLRFGRKTDIYLHSLPCAHSATTFIATPIHSPLSVTDHMPNSMCLCLIWGSPSSLDVHSSLLECDSPRRETALCWRWRHCAPLKH